MSKEPIIIKNSLHPFFKGLIAFIMGLLVNLCFEPFNCHFLAWFAIVPLYLLGLGRHDRGVFFLGSCWGLGYFLGTFYFLYPIFLLCPFLVALIWTPIPGIWLYLICKLRHLLLFPDPLTESAIAPPHKRFLNLRSSFIMWIAAAGLWSCLEWVRTWLFTGLPWNSIEVSQVYQLHFLKNASFIGVNGLAFLIALLNISLAIIIEIYLLRKKSIQINEPYLIPKLKNYLALPVISLFILLSSTIIADKISPKNQTDSSIRVAMIQGNFKPYFKPLSYEEYQFHLQTYKELTETAILQKPDLILWPETPMPSSYQRDPAFPELIRYLSQESQANILFGTGMVDTSPTDLDVKKYYNSALISEPSGEIIARYDKIHTVPYGEYLPGRYLMSSALHEQLNKLRQMGPSLSPGTEFSVFPLKKNSRIGINICFDDVFADISRGFASNGANILCTITNDSWFGETAGGAQHSAHSIFRAVENKLPFLRCGNTCETMVISPEGKIEQILLNPENGSRFTRGILFTELNFCAKPSLTFYNKFPYFIPTLLSIISLSLIFFLLSQMLKRKQTLLKATQTDDN
ncbi:apolipoprotein N-acyltransferase [Lentisphaera profundi]|uniref:Apolipoprotein N-acyltransferase n=1 Tax=Lentisphaera profundi TaxID=1658616 RepID=A0ABY7W216_9BACT|nr:apolipoprotein N-acyltransferase [Lentisphaera profundi]WDE98323.1 apolipoprotein N-acyltransferase [Lentisphaera profundi]